MIQMTKEQLLGYRSDGIGALVRLAQPYLGHRRRLYERWRRKKSENEMMHGPGGPGGEQRAIVAFEQYITNITKGYLGGKEPIYTVSAPSAYALKKRGRTGIDAEARAVEFKQAIDYIRRYNDDAATYVELVHDYLVTTAAYLYVYENELNEIVYTRLDSLQTVAVYDYAVPRNLIGLLRVWQEKDGNGKECSAAELITQEARTQYRNGVEVDCESLAWGDVPCVAMENPDAIAVFEPALTEIDAYEANLNNIKCMTQYNDNAKLMLCGYRLSDPTVPGPDGSPIRNPERAEEERAIMEAPTLVIEEGGDIKWLIKNVDYSGILETLRRYHDLITMLTGVPNMTDEAFSSADNASALGYKLYALDQYAATFDRVARKGLLRLWEVITNRLNLKGADFDFRDITISLPRNIPTDKDKSLARALSAFSGGLLSQETAINQSQMELDAKAEMARQRAERSETRAYSVESGTAGRHGGALVQNSGLDG